MRRIAVAPFASRVACLTKAATVLGRPLRSTARVQRIVESGDIALEPVRFQTQLVAVAINESVRGERSAKEMSRLTQRIAGVLLVVVLQKRLARVSRR